MKLIKSDFAYLGIDLDKYQLEQVSCVLNHLEDITAEDLVDDLRYSEEKSWHCNIFRLHIYSVLYASLINIHAELKLRYHHSFSLYDGFKLILNAMVTLREKGINTYDKTFNRELDLFGKAEMQIEGAEIPDERLHDYKDNDVIRILKERNIERVRRFLFKENRMKLTEKHLELLGVNISEHDAAEIRYTIEYCTLGELLGHYDQLYKTRCTVSSDINAISHENPVYDDILEKNYPWELREFFDSIYDERLLNEWVKRKECRQNEILERIRLNRSFKEEMKQTDETPLRPLKIHAGRETEKRRELEEYMRRYSEVIGIADEEPCRYIISKLKIINNDYKNYKARNSQRDKELLI